MSPSSVERELLNAASTEELGDAFLEMQSRALAFAKVLRLEWSNGSSSEVAKLKKELVTWSDSLKVALDANSVQGEAFRKAESQREAFKATFEASKKEKKHLSTQLKGIEDNLAEAASVHNEAMSEKVQLELEVNELKDYVLTVHFESFWQAVCQAILLYGVPEENEMDENKDVYNGQLMPI